jgi:hypothetical protein
MTDTRGPFRHAPNEPKDFLAEMQARTSHGGDRYLYGFGRGKKGLLFLDKRASATAGIECWRLYTQELGKVIPELRTAPERGPSGGDCGGRLVERASEQRAEFVSGLPDRWGR